MKKKGGPVYSTICELALGKIRAIKEQSRGEFRSSCVINKDNLRSRVLSNLCPSSEKNQSKDRAGVST